MSAFFVFAGLESVATQGMRFNHASLLHLPSRFVMGASIISIILHATVFRQHAVVDRCNHLGSMNRFVRHGLHAGASFEAVSAVSFCPSRAFRTKATLRKDVCKYEGREYLQRILSQDDRRTCTNM